MIKITYFSLWKYKSRSSSIEADSLQSYGTAKIAFASIPNSTHHLTHSLQTEDSGPAPLSHNYNSKNNRIQYVFDNYDLSSKQKSGNQIIPQKKCKIIIKILY